MNYAWTLILSNTISRNISDWLSVLFPYPGSESFGFSTLHEAVLNIPGTRTVKEELLRLVSVTETIND